MRHAAPSPSGPRRHRAAQVPYLLAVAGTGGGLAVMALGPRHVQSGTLVIAGVLLAAALARLILPEHMAGMLGLRRRIFDVLTLGAMGCGLLVAGLVLPPA